MEATGVVIDRNHKQFVMDSREHQAMHNLTIKNPHMTLAQLLRRPSLIRLWLVSLTALLGACGDSALEKLDQQLAEAEARRGVYIHLSADLQSVIAMSSGRLQVSLRRVAADGTQDEYSNDDLAISDNLAHDKPADVVANKSYYYYVQIFWHPVALSSVGQKPLLLAEADKISAEWRVEFAVSELTTAPYDQNGDGNLDAEENTYLNDDGDGLSNLTEIAEGGNPQNPRPSFVSASEVTRIESGDTGGYVFYTARAISANFSTDTTRQAVVYSINEANTNDAIFGSLSINPGNGELATINGNALPDYLLQGDNSYIITLTASDNISSSDLALTLHINDIFNLRVKLAAPILDFSWDAFTDSSGNPADYYQLLQDIEGDGNFVTLGRADVAGNTISLEITETKYQYDIPLHRVGPQTRYKLAAYRRVDTGDIILRISASLRLGDVLNFPQDIVAMISYVKAENVRAGDFFGASVALSADGRTLAVGTLWADSVTRSDGGPIQDCTASPPLEQANCLVVSASGVVHIFEKDNNRWQLRATLNASNAGSDDYFGSRVALSADGRVLAVGARQEDSNIGPNGGPIDDCAELLIPEQNCLLDSGAVYVFQRSEVDNRWREQAYLKASIAGAGDLFGASVALSADGRTLAVGARLEDSNIDINGKPINDCASPSPSKLNCEVDSGAVYVFQRQVVDNSWQEQVILKASNTRAGDLFGVSISLNKNGSTLAVGARFADSTTGLNGGPTNDCAELLTTPINCRIVSNSGAVYVFQHQENSWQEQAVVTATNAGEYDYFGTSLALSDDGSALAVGAGRADSAIDASDGSIHDCTKPLAERQNCREDSGAAYMFRRKIADNIWQEQATLGASNPGERDFFGFSVALSNNGSTLAVGAIWADSTTGKYGGLVNDCSELPSEQQNCTLVQSSGAVYMFQIEDNNNWREHMSVKASNAEVGDSFGWTVALSSDGNTLAVGAAGESSGSGGQVDDCAAAEPGNCQADSGAVYIY